MGSSRQWFGPNIADRTTAAGGRQLSSPRRSRFGRRDSPMRLPAAKSAHDRARRRGLARARRAGASRRPRRSRLPNGSRRFRAKARAKGISDATYHARDGRAEARHDGVLGDPQPAGVQPAALAIHQPPRLGLAHPDRQGPRSKEFAPLLARIEKDFGVERGVMLGLWGIEFDLRRSAREAEPFAPGVSRARGARLGRAAPARLLGDRADQRAAHRARKAGRRRRRWSAHGPARWATRNGCRKSGSMSASTMTATAGSIRSTSRTTRSGSSARYLVNRGKYRRGEHWGYEVRAGGRGSDETSRSYEAWQKLGVTRADGQAVSAPEADGEAVGAGRGRAGLPARPELLRGARPTIRR